MSIINQTLRDLDAREPGAPGSGHAAAPTVVRLARPSRRKTVVALGALTLACALAAAWLSLRESGIDAAGRIGVPASSTGDAQIEASAPPAAAAPRIAPVAATVAPVPVASAVPAVPAVPATVQAVPLEPARAAGPRAEPAGSSVAQAEPVTDSAHSAQIDGPVAAVEAAPAARASAESDAASASATTDRNSRLDPGGNDRTARRAATISKEARKLTPDEEAEDRYRKALTLVNKGRENKARSLLDEALKLAPGHLAARQVLATLLDEAGLAREAEQRVREGRSLHPDETWFVTSLARLQAARGDLDGAAASLQSGLDGRGVTAEYRASYAAILSRLKRPGEAATQYEQALARQPGHGAWWMGLGLALAEQGRSAEARAAYGRALASGNLDDRLAAFVRAKLAE